MELTDNFKKIIQSKCCPVCSAIPGKVEVYNQFDDKLNHYNLYVTLPMGSYAQCMKCFERFSVYEVETTNC